jgi:hypothetical protein
MPKYSPEHRKQVLEALKTAFDKKEEEKKKKKKEEEKKKEYNNRPLKEQLGSRFGNLMKKMKK